MRLNKKPSVWTYVGAIALVLIYLLPIYVLVTMSLRTVQDIGSKLQFPRIINIGNYIAIFREGTIWQGFANSIILVVITCSVEIVFGALAAYGIARSKGRFAKYLRYGSMTIMMIPRVTLLVGTYSLMVKAKMVNTLWGLGLLLAATSMSATMFFYVNFLSSIPRALDEAATIDGASVLQTFFYIIMPQLKAITVTRIIVVANGCWNQYLMPMYLLQDKSKHTIILQIKNAFSLSNGIPNVPKACALCVVGILPVILLYLFLQRYIIEGQIDSSVK